MESRRCVLQGHLLRKYLVLFVIPISGALSDQRSAGELFCLSGSTRRPWSACNGPRRAVPFGSDSCFTCGGVALPSPPGRTNLTHDFLNQRGQVRLFETDTRCWHAVVFDIGWDMLVVWIGTGQLRKYEGARTDHTRRFSHQPDRFRSCSYVCGQLQSQ